MRKSICVVLALSVILTISIININAGAADGRSLDHAASTVESPTHLASVPPSVPPLQADATRVDDSGVIEYELVVTSTRDLQSLSLVVGENARITGTTGLVTTSVSGRTTLRWDGSAERVRLAVQMTADEPATSDDVASAIATDDWVLGRVPVVKLFWQRPTDAGRNQLRPFSDQAGLLSDFVGGTYGDRFALVGEQTSLTRSAAGQRIRLVKPSGTDLRPADEEVLSALATASGHLQVGDRDDEVLVMALPEPARAGGESFPARDESWVNAAEPLNDPNSVWLHEYVHTRQSFQLSSEMEWFREASAEYYGARLAYEQNRISRSEMHAHLDGEGRTASLTDQSTWDDRRVPYTKGARVLALLDRRIRAETDGDRTLQDVFRRMNDHEGQVTYATFKTMVTEVVGHSMDAWLDRYVAGDRAVASFYERPANSGLIAALGVTWTAGSQSAVFFALSTVLSVLTAVPLYVYLRRRQPDPVTGHTPTP